MSEREKRPLPRQFGKSNEGIAIPVEVSRDDGFEEFTLPGGLTIERVNNWLGIQGFGDSEPTGDMAAAITELEQMEQEYDIRCYYGVELRKKLEK